MLLRKPRQNLRQYLHQPAIKALIIVKRLRLRHVLSTSQRVRSIFCSHVSPGGAFWVGEHSFNSPFPWCPCSARDKCCIADPAAFASQRRTTSSYPCSARRRYPQWELQSSPYSQSIQVLILFWNVVSVLIAKLLVDFFLGCSQTVPHLRRESLR